MPVSKPNPNYVPPSNRGAAREPTRTCSNCNAGKVTEKQDDGVDKDGKPQFKYVTVNCGSCGGAGVR